MRSLCMSLLTCVALAVPAAAGPAVIHGAAYAIDGDTLVINGHHIRLFGVDAFERAQDCGGFACGEKARAVMAGLVKATIVTCDGRDVDAYGRMVAVCATAADRDLGADMVKRGLAVAYRTYSRDYIDEEGYARKHRLGAWAYGFDSPVDWRRAHPHD